ncbi:transcription factor IIA, alpha/beta subunit [Morchella snyderi]|nr:transcription factor IIA, alpha/beta subunit [Morchella snyderi]
MYMYVLPKKLQQEEDVATFTYIQPKVKQGPCIYCSLSPNVQMCTYYASDSPYLTLPHLQRKRPQTKLQHSHYGHHTQSPSQRTFHRFYFCLNLLLYFTISPQHQSLMTANQRTTNAAELYPLVMADVIGAARTTFEDAGISVSLIAELESLWKQKLTEANIGELFPWEPQPTPTPASLEPELKQRMTDRRRILRPPSPTPPVSMEMPPHPALLLQTTASKPEIPSSFTSHIISTHTKSEVAHMEHMMQRSRELAGSSDPNEMERMMAKIRRQESQRLLRDADEKEEIERSGRLTATRNYEARLRADRYLASRMAPALNANALDIARATAAVSAAPSICSRDSAAIKRAECQNQTAAAISVRNNEARTTAKREYEARIATTTDVRQAYGRRVIPPAMAAPIPAPTTGMESTGFAETYRQRAASSQMQRKPIPPQLPLQGTTSIGSKNTRPAQGEKLQPQGASSVPAGVSDDQWAYLNTIQTPMSPVQRRADSAPQQTGGISLGTEGQLYWDNTLPFQPYGGTSSSASPADSYIWKPATEAPVAMPESPDRNQPAPEWEVSPELQALVDEAFPPQLAGEVFPPQLDGNDDNDKTELDENDEEEVIGPYGEADDESDDDDDDDNGENTIVCLYEAVKKSKVKRGGTIWKFLLRNGIFMAADGQEYPFSRGNTELVW